MRTLVTLTVGVLAIQGGVSEHILHLEEAIKRILTGNDIFQKGRVVQVKCRKDFKELDGLVIPGGETTVISVFFQRNQFELLEALREFAVLGKPVFGTCAGMILLANKVEGQMRKGQILVGGMDIAVCRNYYGSQNQSFEAYLELEDPELCGSSAIPTTFIRAPSILSLDESKVTILAKMNGSAVAVRQNNYLATSFHPELTRDLTWHQYFLQMVTKTRTCQK